MQVGNQPMGTDTLLAGRVVVVTGGARGLGRTIALAFASHGASVAIGARHNDELRRTHEELVGLGVDAVRAVCDVADEASIGAFGDLVLDALGPPAVVVACAGIAGPTKPMHEIEVDEWTRCIDTDLTGVFLTFRRFIPEMIAAGAGSLIAISSMTGKRPLAGRAPYAAAKMGVIGLVRTLALDLGPFGVRVNSVCPGGIDGPRIDQVFEQQAAALGISAGEARGQMTEPAALKRLVSAREVADACVFLASDGASGITGEDLNVSAGLVMY